MQMQEVPQAPSYEETPNLVPKIIGIVVFIILTVVLVVSLYILFG